MVNNPVLFAAVMTLWHIALTHFLNIAIVIGIVNVMSLVYLFWVLWRPLLKDQWAQ